MLYSTPRRDSAGHLPTDFDLYDDILPSVVAANTSATSENLDDELRPELSHSGNVELGKPDYLRNSFENTERDLWTNEENTCFTVDLNATDTKKWKFLSTRNSSKPLAFVRNDVLLFLGIPPVLSPKENESLLCSTTIVIKNIGWWINDVELRKEATESGSVRALKIFDRVFDGRSIGIALIDFMKPEDAERSLRNLNDSKLETLGNRPISGEIVPEGLIKSLNQNPIHWSLGGPMTNQQLEELYALVAITPTTIGNTVKDNLTQLTSKGGSAEVDNRTASQNLSIAQPHPQFPWFNPAFLNKNFWKKKRKRSHGSGSIVDESTHKGRSHSYKKKKKKIKRHKERKKFINLNEVEQIPFEIDSYAHGLPALSTQSARFHETAFNMPPHVQQFAQYPMAGIPRRAWPGRDPSLPLNTGSGIHRGGQMPLPAYLRMARPMPQSGYSEQIYSLVTSSGYPSSHSGYPSREVIDRNEDATTGYTGYLENSTGWEGYSGATYPPVTNAYREERKDPTFVSTQRGVRSAQVTGEFLGNTTSWQKKSSTSLGHY